MERCERCERAHSQSIFSTKTADVRESGSANVELRNRDCPSTVVDENDLSSSFSDVCELDVEVTGSSLNHDDSSGKIGSIGRESGTSIVLGSWVSRGEVDDVVSSVVEGSWRLVRNPGFTQNGSIIDWEVGDVTARSREVYQ